MNVVQAMAPMMKYRPRAATMATYSQSGRPLGRGWSCICITLPELQVFYCAPSVELVVIGTCVDNGGPTRRRRPADSWWTGAGAGDHTQAHDNARPEVPDLRQPAHRRQAFDPGIRGAAHPVDDP